MECSKSFSRETLSRTLHPLILECNPQDFVHMFDREKAYFFPHVFRQVRKVLLVHIRDNDISNIVSQRGKGLFL